MGKRFEQVNDRRIRAARQARSGHRTGAHRYCYGALLRGAWRDRNGYRHALRKRTWRGGAQLARRGRQAGAWYTSRNRFTPPGFGNSESECSGGRAAVAIGAPKKYYRVERNRIGRSLSRRAADWDYRFEWQDHHYVTRASHFARRRFLQHGGR